MLSYPYIESLFKAILSHSLVIQGRFHISPHHGSELNTNNLDQVLKHSIGEDYKKNKYPLSLMLPPQSTGEYMAPSFRDEYEVIMYFVASTYVSSNNHIKRPNPNTNTSQHTIVQDWHDMKRCAVKFIEALSIASMKSGGQFYIKDRDKPVIDPITTIGNDRVSGVSLTFTLGVAENCTDEDYPADFENIFTLPDAVDSHLEHLH